MDMPGRWTFARSRKVIAVFTLLLFVLTFPAWIPHMPGIGLDQSWITVLQYAHEHGWQWGSDIAITFGPLGYLYSSYYDPAAFTGHLVTWTYFAISAGLGLIVLAGGAGLVPTIIACACMAISFVAFTPDVILFSIPLLLVAVWCSPPGVLRSVALVALVVSCAAIAQIKLSGVLLCTVGVMLIDLGAIYRRSPPFFTAIYCAVGLAIWIASGQSVDQIPAFLVNALSTIGGYDATMQSFGSWGELCAYLLLASLTICVFGAGLVRANAIPLHKRAIIAVCFLAFVLVSFRAGFTRHDLHSLIAWFALGAGASILLLQPWAAGMPLWMRSLAYAIPVASLAGAASMFALTLDTSPMTLVSTKLSPGKLLAEANAAIRAVSGASRASLNEQFTQRFALIAASSKLPKVNASVDVIPSYQVDLIAARSDYRPRPVYQGYAAYTPLLSELNRKFFASEKAPMFVIFGFDPMDNRYPSTIDSTIWPELLARYEPVETKDQFALLKRRSEAADAIALTPSIDQTLALGKATPLWTPSSGAVWAKIKLEETLAGRFLRAVWKAPVVELVVEDASRKRGRYRLVPGNAQAGFLLSPIVETSDHFLQLYVPDTQPSGREVSTISVEVPGWARWFYAPTVTVSLTSLELPTMREGPYAQGPLREGILARMASESKQRANGQ